MPEDSRGAPCSRHMLVEHIFERAKHTTRATSNFEAKGVSAAVHSHKVKYLNLSRGGLTKRAGLQS